MAMTLPLRSARRLLGVLAAAVLVLGVGLSPARAQDLASAQAALTRYDLADPRTYEALENLRRIADANGPEAATARAIRAYAAADLLVAASALGDASALGRLGTALGAQEPAAMIQVLDQQLARTPHGALAVAAAEARATLGALQGRAGRRSPRSDAILLATAPREIAGLHARVLERFDPVVDTTLELPAALDNEVRRMVTAMRAITGSIRAAEQGDPLLLVLRPRLEAIRGQLSAIVIADPTYADVDGFVSLTRTAIAFGYVSRMRVNGDGRPELVSGTPSWPATTTVSLPSELPAAFRPIDGLAANAAITGAHAGRLALVVEGDVPAHLMARVVRSLEGTPLAISMVVAGDRRIGVTFVREDTLPRDVVHVSLRPGGHGITHHAGRRVDIPRVRADGTLRYAHDSLARQLPATGPRAVSANGLAPAAELIATAAIIATEGAVTIVLP